MLLPSVEGMKVELSTKSAAAAVMTAEALESELLLSCIVPAAGFWLQEIESQALMGMLKLRFLGLPWHHHLGNTCPRDTADTNHWHPMQTLQHSLQHPTQRLSSQHKHSMRHVWL